MDMCKQAQDAAIAIIGAKRDALLKERAAIRRQRAEMAERDRDIDRELADCRAAARVLGLSMEFPVDEASPYLKTTAFYLGAEAVSRLKHQCLSYGGDAHTKPISASVQSVQTKAAMPRLSDIALDRLKAAGTEGSKAAPIQDFIERTYSTKIHEKTVGMTLYRLLKTGKVRREGHLWFFVPPDAATKNPGVGAPGSEEVRST